MTDSPSNKVWSHVRGSGGFVKNILRIHGKVSAIVRKTTNGYHYELWDDWETCGEGYATTLAKAKATAEAKLKARR